MYSLVFRAALAVSPALAGALALLPGCERSYTPGSVEVFFSPRGGCTEAIVRELDAAQSSVLVQAYSFTSKPIAEALLHAHRRGVRVQVLLDRSNETDRYGAADFLRNAGLPLAIDAEHATAHNKVMIVDGRTVITGSFNFTKSAESSNAENVLVLQDPALAARYAENWRTHAAHSKEFVSKLEAATEARDGPAASGGSKSSPSGGGKGQNRYDRRR